MSHSKPPHLTVLAVLPFVVMVIVAVVDVGAGPGVGYLPLVSLGPAFAGLVGGWRRTAIIGAAALLLCTALGLYNESYSQRRLYTAMASVAGVTAAGVAAAVMRQRREAELANVRSIAEVAQRVLLRPVPRSAGPLRIASSYTSAVAEARIGGDLYEVVDSPHGVRVIVGDVQGKGLEAVETASLVLGAFREAAHEEPDLTSAGARVERVVNRELRGEKFVTAILAEVADDRHVITLVNYGHPAPMLVRPDGTTRFPEPPEYAAPLGLGLHDVVGPEPYEADFMPGDQVLLYTDGVSEARDHTGAFYPLGDHSSLLDERDPETALNAIRTGLVRHAQGPLHDDAAMLLLRYQDDREQ
ncbi:PP2C family protein-serine/threonine phosphatase [Streptomyces alfalfae]|uniref:Serine/threonine-protein phosphatase n=1 Tax=Streptomyces alfalfae TaxID=1642299 RepID=A0A7T4PN72_9ACTN|nr:PP2C family protein-serine/threonine phosphatase [Streptomyces alfalfae]QQC93325.1 serine/threonine-protein phosphatase [Streptomyces alfalfae]